MFKLILLQFSIQRRTPFSNQPKNGAEESASDWWVTWGAFSSACVRLTGDEKIQVYPLVNKPL